MIRTRWRAAAAGATVFMLGQLIVAAPVGAVTPTATVTADMPSAAPAGRLWTFNDFFPRTVTVRTGTDLQFINQGFHTFTVLPAGSTPRPDWRSNGVAKDDTDDTTLNANGTTKTEFNVPALSPTSTSCGNPRRLRAPSTDRPPSAAAHRSDRPDRSSSTSPRHPGSTSSPVASTPE